MHHSKLCEVCGKWGECARGERVCLCCKRTIMRRIASDYQRLRHVRTLSRRGTEMIGRRVWRLEE